MPGDERLRRERAQRLREEIEALKGGKPTRPPTSPREFTEQAAQEPIKEEREAAQEDAD